MIDSKNPLSTPTPMWQAVIDPAAVPETSMLPPSDTPAMVGDDLMQRAVGGAHATIDRLADGVAPAVHKLGERVASAEDTLQAQTDLIREKRDQWSESMRTAVRSRPLAYLAGALALGALIARITR